MDARPTKAEDIDTSLWCKALQRDLTKEVLKDGGPLAPQQLSVGVKGTCNILVLGLKLKIEEAMKLGHCKVLVSLDLKNAHNAFNRRKAQEALETAAAADPRLRPLVFAHHAISSQYNPIYVRSSRTNGGLRFLCESRAGGGQGNALTNIIFPMVIDSALKTTEAEFGIEVRAQQDDISLFGDPDKIFGAGKALESILEKLSEVGLEPNKKKFQTFGTSANALVNKPDWLDAPFEITDPGDAARVAEAEAAASEAAARARNAHSEDADEATLAAAEAAEMARETRSQVPEEHRAYGVWICGAPIGSAGFIAIRLNRIRVRLCGSDTDGENTDQGELLSLISTLAAEDPHVAHTAIHYSVQNRVDFILQTNLPEETRTLAQAVDKTIERCYELAFGADLLDPGGPSDPNFSADPTFVRDLFTQKVKAGGGGYRVTAERAPFLNSLNLVAPQLLPGPNETGGLWPSLASVFGAGSFTDANKENRWSAFYASGSKYGTQLREEWLRLQGLRDSAAADAGLTDLPKSVLDAESEGFGHKCIKLHKSVFDHIKCLRSKGLNRRALALRRDDPRRISYLARSESRTSNVLLTGTPTEECRFTPHDFRSAVQNQFGVAQSCLAAIIGLIITNHVNCPTLHVDKYGYNLKTVTGTTDDATRQLHNAFQNTVSKWLCRARIPHKGGAWGKPRSCKDIFSGLLNRLADVEGEGGEEARRWRQGIIPDLVINALDLTHLSEGSAQRRYGNANTMADVKTLAPGGAYSQSAATTKMDAVLQRELKVTNDYHTAASKLDERYHGTAPEVTGPIEAKLNTYNSGKVSGIVVGAFAEVSPAVEDLADLIASELAASYMEFYEVSMAEARSMQLQRVNRAWGLAAHRGWARLLHSRIQDTVEYRRQPGPAERGQVDEDELDAAENYFFHRNNNFHHGPRTECP